MGYLGYYLLASIVISFWMIIRTVMKSEHARHRLSYLSISSIIVLLMLFSIAHAYHLLGEATLLVIFLSLFPLFALSYLFITYTILGLTQRERSILLAYVAHTVVVLGIMAVLSWHDMMAPLTAPFFCYYVIISTIAGCVIGLVWSWRTFKKATEFEQTCTSCFLLASIIFISAFFVNLAIYPVCSFLWSSIFLLPYLIIVSNILLGSNIARIERIEQAFLVEVTIFSIYYCALFLFAHFPGFEERLFAVPFCCNYMFIFCLIAIVFTYSTVKHVVVGMYKRILFRPVVNYRLLFRNFSNALLAFVDIDKIAEVIVNILHDGYDVKAVSCFLLNMERKKYVLQASAGDKPSVTEFDDSHQFVVEIKRKFRVLSKGNIPQKDALVAHELMNALHAEVAIPFQYQGGYVGFVFVGKKKDSTQYNDDDIELFSTLEGQISVAMNNALFFKTQHDSYELMAQKNKMDAVIALSSGVNHEINNPLSIISMKSQNFLRKISQAKFSSQEETIKEATDVIESALRNAGRAHMITRRLGDFAKPVKDLLDPEDLDLREYIKEAVSLIGENKFSAEKITLNYDLPDYLDRVRCDKSHLRQILFNVIINAFHAIGSEGAITMTAHNDDNGFVCLKIIDDGCGIKADELEKIWEPFFTTKPQKPVPENKFTGSGLGLALVRRYVEHSGGRVEVESIEGKGTTFLLYFQRVHGKKDKGHNGDQQRQEGENR